MPFYVGFGMSLYRKSVLLVRSCCAVEAFAPTYVPTVSICQVMILMTCHVFHSSSECFCASTLSSGNRLVSLLSEACVTISTTFDNVEFARPEHFFCSILNCATEWSYLLHDDIQLELCADVVMGQKNPSLHFLYSSFWPDASS